MNSPEDKVNLFVSCAKGLESLLLEELKNLGADDCRETVTGVTCTGNHAIAMRICLWSRLANRVLLLLAKDRAYTKDEVFKLSSSVEWNLYFGVDKRIAVDFSGSSKDIRHTQFGAQLIKDTIVDCFRENEGKRPDVDPKNADVRINVRLSPKNCYIGIDLGGESLHKRLYRQGHGMAPIKENLAAALLLRADWPALAKAEKAILDPLCGSATILIEAAMIAADIAPGIRRERWGFMALKSYSEQQWTEIKEEAVNRRTDGIDKLKIPIIGCEKDKNVYFQALDNVRNAGLESKIRIYNNPFNAIESLELNLDDSGLAITNPPYGDRLGDVNSLSPEYQKLGEVCKSQLAGWQLAVISSNKELLQELRLRPEKKYRLYNGPLECEFRIYQLRSKTERDEHEQNSADKEAAPRSLSLSEGEQMLVNRLKKNQRRLKSWLKKSNITCYRLYDADMPEYSAAIDIYGDKVHIQEYKAPLTIDEKTAELRFKEIVSAVKVHLNAASTSVFTKIRQRNKGKSQYKTIEAPTEQDYFWVEEGAANLRVNLKSYIDTGLFLDHRPLRKIIFNEAKGKRFLNLFCYTATASVHAALGGADRSVSVDMSNTYLEWAKLNYLNNNVSLKNHDLVRADVVEWLKGAKEKYDIIMLDPPSFSNSKKMEATLDIQRDHESFIKQCMAILAPGGSLYFSCNLRGFKFEPSLSESFDCDNILQSSLDLDFERRPKIHHCWKITHQAL